MTRTPHYCGSAITIDQIFAAARTPAQTVRDTKQVAPEKPSAISDATGGILVTAKTRSESMRKPSEPVVEPRGLHSPKSIGSLPWQS